jgi:F420H(2)-dependent biliverdin reductase
MAVNLTQETLQKLETQTNLWFCSVRPDGRPHLAPVWFVWFDEKIYIGTDPKSVKAHNILTHPSVVVALEDATHAVICEGTARVLEVPLSVPLLETFLKKYEWDLTQDTQYNQVVEVSPLKWMVW